MRFCTLFDLNYAPQGLALIASLRQWCPGFTLDVLALTDGCQEMLSRVLDAGDDRVRIHVLNEIAEKTQRPILEMASSMPWKHFCWAMNAIWTEWVLENYRMDVMSLDADTFFFSNPESVLLQCTDFSVAAPPHRFPPYLEHTAEQRGKYNVGAVWFAFDRMGREMAQWWADRVCEQCDEQSCGDQRYWDVLANMAGKRFLKLPLGFNMAPWMNQFRYGKQDGHVIVHSPITRDEGVAKLIHYHFHEFSITQHRKMNYRSVESDRIFGLSNYLLRSDVLHHVYAPYTQEVERSLDMIASPKR